MKIKLLVYSVLQILCLSVFAQTTYYVSSVGDDANNGQTAANAFKSISKLNTLTFNPGDQILFRRGDTFQGMFVIQQSGTSTAPIVIDAYGVGQKPVITGSVPVSGWTNVGGDIWQATCSSCGDAVTGLFLNGRSLPLARYPNENTPNRGYLTVQTHTGKVSLTSQQALVTNWAGGEVVYRPTLWILNRALVTAQSGNTLTLDNANAAYEISDGWGFFIQNHPSALDQNGEWCYAASNKTIRLLSAQSPVGQGITATVFVQGIRLLNNSNIVVRNLHITQQLGAGLYGANISNTLIEDNNIEDIGEDGMLIHGVGRNVTIKDNTIRRVNNNGTEIHSYTALTYRNNTISQVALRPGRGKSGDGQYRGVDISVTTDNLLENNHLDSIGYTGISFSTQTTGLIIRRNVISNYLLTKSDGGGIYTFNGNEIPMSNIKIQSNFVSGGASANEGAIVGPTFTGANGIYLDYCITGVEVSDNTVYGCRGIGIFAIGSLGNSIVRNNVFDNSEGQLVVAAGLKCPPRNNTINNNILVSRQSTTPVARYESDANDLNLYGSIDNNYYVRPFDNVLLLNAAFLDNNVGANNPIGIADWRRFFGRDLNTKTSPIVYKGFTVNSLNEASRTENSFFNGNALNWYTQSYYGNFKTEFDNTNKLDGGSMRLYFSPSSGYRASYGFVFGNAFNIIKGRSYVLRFDAVASSNGKTIQAILRQRNFPATDLAIRVGSLVNTTRQKYEIAFTATQSDPDAILLFSVLEDGQSVWLDNITFQEATITRTDPNSVVKLALNNTMADTLVNLDGNYRDVNNVLYSRQISLAPFTSAVLLRDTTATVDLALSLRASKVSGNVQEVINYSLIVRNDESTSSTLTSSAQWVCRLPPNVQFIGGTGVTNNNGVLTGQTPLLGNQATATFTFQLRIMQPGTYRLAAEINSSSRPDIDSTPGSGTADGEDDAQQFTIRTIQPGSLYVSPNPNQRRLPQATLNELTPNPTSADLKVQLQGSTRLITLNQVFSYTVSVMNQGGADAPDVQLQVQLPTGLAFVDGANWTANSSVLTGALGYVPAGATHRVVFRVRSTAVGNWSTQVQIIVAGINDPDSVVNNGYTNGEDDRASADVRVQ